MIRYITDDDKILESANYILREIPKEPFYEVVNCKTGKPLAWILNNCGYVRVGPLFNGKRRPCGLHRLILSTFCPEGYFPGAEANHIDENKLNCKLSNLNWLDHSGNINHGSRNQRVAEVLGKPVLQYTKEGIFVDEYPSTQEAHRQNPKISRSSINWCCLGKAKSAGGYIWKWKS